MGFLSDYARSRVEKWADEMICDFTERDVWPACQRGRPCSRHSFRMCWACGWPAARECFFPTCEKSCCGKHPHEPEHAPAQEAA